LKFVGKGEREREREKEREFGGIPAGLRGGILRQWMGAGFDT